MASSRRSSSTVDQEVLESSPSVAPKALPLGKWNFILDTLVNDDLINSVDPKLHVAELRDVDCLTSHEWDIMKAKDTGKNKMIKLLRFLRTRPSMFGALRDMLSKSHKPLLKIMEKASNSWREEICKDEDRFKAALHTLDDELCVLGEWAAPYLIPNCLNEKEADKVTQEPCSLLSLLTDATAPSKRWIPFLTFLEEKQPDLLLFLDRALHYHEWLLNRSHASDETEVLPPSESFEKLKSEVHKPEATCESLPEEKSDLERQIQRLSESEPTGSSAAAVREKIGALERELRDLQATCESLREEKSSLERKNQRLSESAMRRIILYNDVTETENYGRTTSLPVSEAATAREVRRKVAELLRVPSASVILNRHVADYKDMEIVVAKDDDGERTFAVGVVEFPWVEMQTLQWRWTPFEDGDVVPHFQNRRVTIRASSAPLLPFRVINEVADYVDGKNLWQHFPFRDGGTAGELKTAVGRWMGISPASLVISRRVAQYEGVDVVEVTSEDRDWKGFSNSNGDITCSHSNVEWRWSTPDDRNTFPLASNHRNTIRVSSKKKRKSSKLRP